jgi:para-nitrobenzyl esterase
LSPYDAYAAGRQNDVPILIGSNANEAGSMITDLDATTAATFESDIARRFGKLPPPLLAAYPRATDADARNARLGFERDIRFGWDMWAWARLAAAKSRYGIFYYHFTKAPPFPENSIYRNWGASHFAELWYVFDQLGQETWNWTAADRRLAQVMSGYWVNFTKTGNPNSGGLPSWPRYTAADPKVQYLGDAIVAGGVPNLGPLQVFDQVYDGLRGAAFGLPSPP